MDWTVVLTTLIGAGAGFGGTYLGYRGTIKALEAENTRLREERAAEHFNHRQSYYHTTLILLDRLHKAITGVIGMEGGDFLFWMQQFQGAIAGTTPSLRSRTGSIRGDVQGRACRRAGDA